MTVLRQLVVTLDGQVVLTSTVSRDRYTIGRLPDNDLVLPDSGVSPQHAELRAAFDECVFTDLGSDEGSLIAGVRLLPHHPHALKDGETIHIAPYEITFRSQAIEESSKSKAMPAADAPPDTLTAGVDAASGTTLRFRAHRPQALSAPAGADSCYLQFLPIIFQESDFLGRFLQIFESIWEPLEQRQDHINFYFSPRTCPTSWLPWFAGWFGLELSPHWPEARVRALLAETPELYRWRGTNYGLTRILEVCIGARPEIVEIPEQPFVFRVRVQLPPASDPDVESIVEELIQAHKPAHTGYVLEVQR